MEEPLRKSVSPDGKLTLELFSTDEYYLGFAGQAWHTHGDLLVPEYGENPESAALGFFDAVVSDREAICVSKRIGKEEAISITHDPEAAPRYMEEGEVLQLRFWSGIEISRHEKRG